MDSNGLEHRDPGSSLNGRGPLTVVQVVGNSIVGGAETHVLWLLDGLVRAGVKVPEVICPQPGPLTEALARRGFRVRCIPLGDWEDQGPVDAGSVELLKEALAETRPDVVHFHLHPALVHGALAAHGVGIRAMAYTGHGIEPIRPGDVELPVRFQFPVIAVAHAAADSLCRAGLPRELIEVVYNGVPEGFFKTDPQASARLRRELAGDRSPVLGTVARLSWEKGNDQAIRALPHIVSEFPDALLLVAGEGAQADALVDLVDELGVRRNVLFLGSRTDTVLLYQTFDVFLLPSRSEACPLALLEAMAVGKACVATTVGGVPEIIRHREEGLLVPPEQPQELAAAILSLLRDDELCNRLARAARRRVASAFTADGTTRRTLDLYLRLAGAAGHPVSIAAGEVVEASLAPDLRTG